MKDKRTTPMYGDRAVIISGESRIGTEVHCLSDPTVGFIGSSTHRYLGTKLARFNRINPISNGKNDRPITVVQTRNLLRIPPDEEMKQMFAHEDQDQPIKEKAT